MKLTSMKKQIMFGVYVLYAVRKLSASWRKPFMAEVAIFLIIAATMSIFVSVPSVLANMSNSGNFYRYLMIAFSNTTFLVQLLFLLAISTMILSLRNFGNIVAIRHLSPDATT